MKHGAPAHPKTAALAAALKIERWGAVGILESLWHYAAEYTPDGAVGRYSDAAIVSGIGWNGKPGPLVKALVKTRWLDVVEGDARLVIHDWFDHAPDHVHRKLVREHRPFANGMPPKLNRADKEERAKYLENKGITAESEAPPESRRMRTIPSQNHTLPNHTQPEPSPASSSPASGGGAEEDYFKGWSGLQSVRFLVNGKPSAPATKTIEELCRSHSDAQLKAVANDVRRMQLANKLKKDAAAMLTTMLKAGSGGIADDAVKALCRSTMA